MPRGRLLNWPRTWGTSKISLAYVNAIGNGFWTPHAAWAGGLWFMSTASRDWHQLPPWHTNYHLSRPLFRHEGTRGDFQTGKNRLRSENLMSIVSWGVSKFTLKPYLFKIRGKVHQIAKSSDLLSTLNLCNSLKYIRWYEVYMKGH